MRPRGKRIGKYERELLIAGLDFFRTYERNIDGSLGWTGYLPGHLESVMAKLVEDYDFVHVYVLPEPIKAKFFAFGEMRMSPGIWTAIEPKNPLFGRFGAMIRMRVRRIVAHPFKSFANRMRTPAAITVLFMVATLYFESSYFFGSFAGGALWLFYNYLQHTRQCDYLSKLLRHPFG
jgi:hypothetical protein